VHVTLLSPLFTPVGPLAAESKFQQIRLQEAFSRFEIFSPVSNAFPLT
jgi:hypothetical protein